MIFGRRAPLRVRMGVMAAAYLVGVGSMLIAYPLLGQLVGVVAFVLAVMGGWTLGVRRGIASGVLSEVAATIVFVYFGESFWDHLRVTAFVLPMLTGLAAAAGAMGNFVERIHAERDRLANEIARREEAEAALLVARAASERAERLSSIGVLVAGIAHEINNPLAYMRGNAELALMIADEIRARSDLPAEVQAKLSEICRGQESALKGIDRIAFITQSLRRTVTMRPEAPTDLQVGALVDTALAAARPHIASGVDVVVNVSRGLRARANAEDTIEIITHLLNNAAEAMGESGKIEIAAANDKEGIEITVSDSGPGIAPADAHKIFTPFHTTKPNGTGLGLSLSYRMAVDQHGRLEFTSGPAGRGTTFHLHLPAPTSPEARPLPAAQE